MACISWSFFYLSGFQLFFYSFFLLAVWLSLTAKQGGYTESSLLLCCCCDGPKCIWLTRVGSACCLLFVLGLLICSRFRFGYLCFSDKRILFLLYISALHSCIHHWIFLVNFHICNSTYSNQLLVLFRSYLVLVRHVINGLQAPPKKPDD